MCQAKGEALAGFLIELEGVGRTYRDGGEARVEALRDVSLAIEEGEFVCLSGPSGAGKSTLMQLLGCLDRPGSGSYRFSGREVWKLGADGLAWLRCRAFGFVFQDYSLLESATAQENVELPALYAGLVRAERKRRALAASGFGVMAVMLMSVTARTREIGLRMAMGARRRDIRKQFLAEAGVMMACGGLAGALATLATVPIVANLGPGFPVRVSAAWLLGMLAGATAAGMLFGLAAARRAAGLNPAEALADA